MTPLIIQIKKLRDEKRELTIMLGVALRYEMQEAGVALDSDMKNFSLLQYSA